MSRTVVSPDSPAGNVPAIHQCSALMHNVQYTGRPQIVSVLISTAGRPVFRCSSLVQLSASQGLNFNENKLIVA